MAIWLGSAVLLGHSTDIEIEREKKMSIYILTALCVSELASLAMIAGGIVLRSDDLTLIALLLAAATGLAIVFQAMAL